LGRRPSSDQDEQCEDENKPKDQKEKGVDVSAATSTTEATQDVSISESTATCTRSPDPTARPATTTELLLALKSKMKPADQARLNSSLQPQYREAIAHPIVSRTPMANRTVKGPLDWVTDEFGCIPDFVFDEEKADAAIRGTRNYASYHGPDPYLLPSWKQLRPVSGIDGWASSKATEAEAVSQNVATNMKRDTAPAQPTRASEQHGDQVKTQLLQRALLASVGVKQFGMDRSDWERISCEQQHLEAEDQEPQYEYKSDYIGSNSCSQSEEEEEKGMDADTFDL